jgi:hypothetical protein
MSAYSRGDASLENYLVKIIAALCKMNGGQLRLKGELVDMIDQSVMLMKHWDSLSQELVLTTNTGSFPEVFIARPEKQPAKEVIAADPIRRQAQEEIPLTLPLRPRASTLDDERTALLEKKVDKVRLARKIREEIDAANREARA